MPISPHLRVLIIDDEADMCWALQRIIESDGHSCTVAKNAYEALQAVARESFHLAFVDVKLPDMDGLELGQQLHCQSPTLRCIVVSGFYYADDDPVQTAVQSGAIAGFISKPFRLEQIQQAIRSVL